MRQNESSSSVQILQYIKISIQRQRIKKKSDQIIYDLD